jgi:hypothetical protein
MHSIPVVKDLSTSIQMGWLITMFSGIRSIWLFLFTMLLASGIARGWALEGPTSFIDERGRFILNGQPFFPLGLYVVQCTNGNYSRELDEIADSPFDTLMNYAINKCGTDSTDAQILSYLDQVESRNLKLIFSLIDYFGRGQKDVNTIAHKVQTFKDHPAVICWYMNDERDPAYLGELTARYRKIRKLDGNHPVWSVHWNTKWLLMEAHTTDIVGVDPYPIDSKPITLVSQMADAANKAGKPLWLVPQIFSWTDYPADFRSKTGRPPTRDEMRAMTYLAINHGAKGLVYYSYFNIRNDADFHIRWPQLKEIAREVDNLRSVILSIERTDKNEIICNNKDIDFKLMRKHDAYYLSAVNTKKKTISNVSFRNKAQHKQEIISVLFEDNRQLVVNKDNFTDDFGPYEVHIYHWKAASP